MKPSKLKRHFFNAIVFMGATYFSAVISSEANSSIAKKFQKFYDSEEALTSQMEASRANFVAKSYYRLFSSEQNALNLKTKSTEDIDLLFRAAYDALFYTFERKYIDDMLIDLNELDGRHYSVERYYGDLYKSLVRVRDFSAAQKFAEQHTFTHENIPAIEYDGDFDHRPSELVLSSGGNILTRRPVKLPPGPWVIVIGHPLCHFSQNATKFIERDSALRDLFMNYSQWIMPQDGVMHVNIVERWNKDHTASDMGYIYHQKDLPVIDQWATPNFYFFMDGKLVGRLTGWPPAGGVEELRKELRKIGLTRNWDGG